MKERIVGRGLRRRRTLGRRAFVAFCFAGSLAFVNAAHAVRACEEDPLITGRTCDVVTCLSLQAAVKSGTACGDPAAGNAPKACRNVATCAEKREMLARWTNCAQARDRINAICWRGGDPGHTIASGQAWLNVSACVAELAEECDDPCPWDFSPLVSAPSESSAGLAAGDELGPLLEHLAAEGLLDVLLTEGCVEDPAACTPDSER